MNQDHLKKIRAFFAIDIPDAIKAAIDKELQQFHNNPIYKNVKWVKPENWHITLRFLGNVSAEQLDMVKKEIVPALKPIKAFPLNLTDLIPFPSAKKIHVLAIKPESIALLMQLAIIIDRVVVNCEVAPEDRAFNPHLTVGRINYMGKMHFDGTPLGRFDFAVSEIKLYKSELTKAGSIYSLLANYPLEK
ncbi:MAG: RNA 2',3'-cyclic phosphodiesterase [Gammaproteobacteria bacterium]|nr:RNA 2',3'-cyclic phosphodiesterase [Gammaproteobacteria bacterium]